jgi:predicted nucleic acid-binding protein
MHPQGFVKTRYLDASALVKLVIDEDDHLPLRQFFKSNVNFATTSLCLAEALGVIKGKRSHGRISEDQYFAATRELVIGVWGRRIEVDEIDLFTLQGLAPVEALAKKHSLDLSDALQLETIMHGRYSHLGPLSASVLITADARLACAANIEGIRVWNCIKSDPPDWV